jgi:hypothetical protein
MLVPDKDTSDSYFNKEATFVPLPDMWFTGFFAFESVAKPSYFIRLTDDEELVLDRYDGTSEFKQEASFQLKRKPCATCLQIGVKTWAKSDSGEYYLGSVTAIDQEYIHVAFEDDRVVPYVKTETTDLVPDIVPGHEDITLGSTVLAQWLQRDTLYPGVVSSIRGMDEYEVLFDDGDVDNMKAFQIRLMRPHVFRSENVEPKNANCRKCSKSSMTSKEKVQLSSSIDRRRKNGTLSPNPDSTNNKSNNSSTKNSLEMPSDAYIENHLSPSNTQKFTFPPWEVETFSQDSGYQGNHDNGYQGIKKSSTVPCFDVPRISQECR